MRRSADKFLKEIAHLATLNISNVDSQKSRVHLHKWKSLFLHALIKFSNKNKLGSDLDSLNLQTENKFKY